MPHFVLELSDNVLEKPDFKEVFKRLHTLLVENGPFHLEDIKSRAVVHANYVVADGDEQNGFVHLVLSIFKGRDLTLRQTLGEKLLSFLKQEFARSYEALNCSITVDIVEIERETYFKAASGKLRE
jgi:5-carboxymethyl-2-hydroxymuconate isomerase